MLSIIAPSLCWGQNVVENPSGSQTIVQPSGTSLSVNSLENIKFANQYGSVQLAINALPTTRGTVYLSPGSYTGPTSIPSNVSLVSLASPAAAVTLSSLGLQNTNTSTQVTLLTLPL